MQESVRLTIGSIKKALQFFPKKSGLFVITTAARSWWAFMLHDGALYAQGIEADECCPADKDFVFVGEAKEVFQMLRHSEELLAVVTNVSKGFTRWDAGGVVWSVFFDSTECNGIGSWIGAARRTLSLHENAWLRIPKDVYKNTVEKVAPYADKNSHMEYLRGVALLSEGVACASDGKSFASIPYVFEKDEVASTSIFDRRVYRNSACSVVSLVIGELDVVLNERDMRMIASTKVFSSPDSKKLTSALITKSVLSANYNAQYATTKEHFLALLSEFDKSFRLEVKQGCVSLADEKEVRVDRRAIDVFGRADAIFDKMLLVDLLSRCDCGSLVVELSGRLVRVKSQRFAAVLAARTKL